MLKKMEKATRYILISFGVLAGGGIIALIVNSNSKLRADSNVLFIGDSYTAGNSSYADQLAKMLPSLRVKKIAKVGEKTDWMLRNAGNEIDSKKYKAVFVLGGINDVYAGSSLNNIENNLQAIYDKAKRAGAKVIAVTIPPTNYYGSYTDAKGYEADKLNYWIKKNRSVNKVIDMNTMLKAGGKQNLQLFASDKLHATPQAHGMLANEIKKNIFRA